MKQECNYGMEIHHVKEDTVSTICQMTSNETGMTLRNGDSSCQVKKRIKIKNIRYENEFY